MVEAFHPRLPGTRNDGRVSSHAETALKEFDFAIAVDQGDARINDYVEWHRLALPFFQLSGIEIAVVFFPVFDHRKLDRRSNLRRCQPDAGSILHRLAHELDQQLYAFAPDLFH